jgi:hypothetical protein
MRLQQLSLDREPGRQDFLQLLQLGVLRLGFLQDRDVRIGAFPERKEVLVGGAGVRSVVLGSERSRQAELSQWINLRPHGQAAAGQDFAKLQNGVAGLTARDVRFPTQKMIVKIAPSS